jgi:hypothetical protein
MYAVISFYVLDGLADPFFLYHEIFVYVIHALTSLLYVHKVVLYMMHYHSLQCTIYFSFCRLDGLQIHCFCIMYTIKGTMFFFQIVFVQYMQDEGLIMIVV